MNTYRVELRSDRTGNLSGTYSKSGGSDLVSVRRRSNRLLAGKDSSNGDNTGVLMSSSPTNGYELFFVYRMLCTQIDDPLGSPQVETLFNAAGLGGVVVEWRCLSCLSGM